MVYMALTIAGSGSVGGAGIQAILKTFQELGVFGASADIEKAAKHIIAMGARAVLIKRGQPERSAVSRKSVHEGGQGKVFGSCTVD